MMTVSNNVREKVNGWFSHAYLCSSLLSLFDSSEENETYIKSNWEANNWF